MKRVLLVLAVAGVLVSCGNKKKGDKPADGKDTTVTTTTTNTGDQTTTTTTDNSGVAGVPTFSDPDVQKFANDVTTFVNGYIDAAKTKDMAKMTELSTKWTEWGTKATDISMKLASKPDEAKKWGEYWTKLGQQWADAAKSLIPSTPK